MSKAEKCPKCGGEMIMGTRENLVRNFDCTRGEPKPEDLQLVKVQPYYCNSCGYMEFYRKLVARKGKTLTLTEDADKAVSLHQKERRD